MVRSMCCHLGQWHALLPAHVSSHALVSSLDSSLQATGWPPTHSSPPPTGARPTCELAGRSGVLRIIQMICPGGMLLPADHHRSAVGCEQHTAEGMVPFPCTAVPACLCRMMNTNYQSLLNGNITQLSVARLGDAKSIPAVSSSWGGAVDGAVARWHITFRAAARRRPLYFLPHHCLTLAEVASATAPPPCLARWTSCCGMASPH